MVSAPRVFTDSEQDGSAQIPIDRQMLVRMIILVSVGAPDRRPALRGPQRLLAGAQDDPQRFVVEYERQAGHGPLSVVRLPFYRASGLPPVACSQGIYGQRITENGGGVRGWQYSV